MKILISGGSGFIGTNLILKFSKKKEYKIINLDNHYREGTKENQLITKNIKNVEFHKVDISNKKILKKFKNISLIIMCASEPSILAGFDNGLANLMQSNFIGTLNLLELAKKNNSNVIFLSTNRVYSIDQLNKINLKKKEKRFELDLTKKIKGLTKKGIDEKFSTNGLISYYGLSKYFSERLIQEYCHNNNINYIINRFGIIAGEYQLGRQDQGIISFWLKSFIKKKSLSYFGYGGEGLQVRDVLNVQDLCNLIEKQFLSINTINNKIFNVGGGLSNSISLSELSNFCREITGNDIKINSTRKNRVYDIPYYVTNNKKIKNYYDWHPNIKPRKTIEDTFNWLIKTNLY